MAELGVGVQSFGYQYAEDYGCTLWIPLHPIDTKGSGGEWPMFPSMSYREILSTRLI